MTTSGAEKRILLATATVARYLFLTVSIAICLLALALTWVNAQTPLPESKAVKIDGQGQPSQPDAKDLQAAAETLREQTNLLREESSKLQKALDEQRLEAERFRWLLTVILGVGALYSLFQVLYSYLNLQELKSQAKSAIDSIVTLRKDTEGDLARFKETVTNKTEEDFRKFVMACQIEFPMFGGLDRALNKMYLHLESHLSSAPVGYNLYDKLQDFGKQEIFYYERSVALIEGAGSERLFNIFLHFSRFYSDKYRSDRSDPKKQPSGGDMNDLGRAHYYLRRADLLPGVKNFRVSNQRGYIAVLGGTPPDLNLARQFFEESATLEKKQQCAHYNMARIDHLHGTDAKKANDIPAAKHLLRTAVAALKTIREFKNWEDTPSEKKATSINYNLACGLSQLASLEPDGAAQDALLKESFDALRSAVEKAPEERDHFKIDCDPGGDLHFLRINVNYQDKFAAFTKLIDEALQKP